MSNDNNSPNQPDPGVISEADNSLQPLDENVLDFDDGAVPDIDTVELTEQDTTSPTSDVEVVDEPQGEPTNEEFEERRIPEPSPAPVHENVNYDLPVYEAIKTKVNGTQALVLVPKRISRIQKDVANWKLSKAEQNDPDIASHSEDWLYGAEQLMASSFIKDRGYFERTLDEEGSDWTQELEHDGINIGLRIPNIRDAGKPRNLKGMAARDVVTSILGTGVSTRVGLPHSGVQLVIGTRPDADLLNLDIALAFDKGKAGHETSGLIFQNSNYAIAEKVSQFIFASVRSCNIRNWEDIDLGDVIRITDLPILYWGQATTLYPNGYPLELPCSTNPAECRHIETVNVNLNRLAWYNRRGLSTKQLDHLSKPSHQYTREEILEYQKLSERKFSRAVDVGYGMKLHLQVPTVNEFIQSGRQFVDDATRALETIMTDKEMTEANKRNFIQSHLALSAIREYGHWIEKLVINRNTTIDERTTLDDMLTEISSKGDVVSVVFEEIQKFIEDCTVAVIAVPNFSCPKCGHDYSNEENSKHPELVPINPLKLFFELKDRRLMRRDPEQIS